MRVGTFLGRCWGGDVLPRFSPLASRHFFRPAMHISALNASVAILAIHMEYVRGFLEPL